MTANGGNVVYTPATNFDGTDLFTYSISDGNGGTDTATVNVTVNAVNDAPIANEDTATTDEDTAVTIAVLGNDTDPDGHAVTLFSAFTTNGTVDLGGGSVVYTPAVNFNGPAPSPGARDARQRRRWQGTRRRDGSCRPPDRP